MSQSFKLKFDHLKENDPTPESIDEDISSVVEYPSAGNTRNICFEWLNGRKQFLNYAYLISCEFDPETKKITMQFTTHYIRITGEHLNVLFDSLLSNAPKIIKEIEERYKLLNEEEPHITSIDSVSI